MSSYVEEIWKDVPGFPGYRCSNRGEIISYRKTFPRELSLTLHDSKDTTGYLSVTLHDSNGEPHSEFVHRVVAMTFLPDFDESLTVNHKDGNRQNNCVENLEMMTREDNFQHFLTSDFHNDNKTSWRKHLSEQATQRYSNPEERKRLGEAISKAYQNNEEAKKRKSEASKRNWQNASTRERIVAAMKDRVVSDEQKATLSGISKSLWQDEEYRKKNLQSRLGKKFIYNPSTDIQKVVKIEEISQYQSQGWIIGKRPYTKAGV